MKISRPRYNVITSRVDDDTYSVLLRSLQGKSLAMFVAEAVAEKLRNDRQIEIDMAIRAAGF